MKNENPLHTFESWRQEKELYSLLESADLLIKESSINESDTSFESMTDDELEEACEKECQAFLEDTAFLEDDNKLEEDKATKVAAVGAAAAAGTLGTIAGIGTTMVGPPVSMAAIAAGAVIPTVTTFSLGTAIAASATLLPVFGAVAGIGLLIYRVLKKKKELKIALKGESPGTAKYEEVKKRLKSLSMSELQEYNKSKNLKHMTKGLKDGIKGKSNPPEDSDFKGPYEEGFKKGEAARKEAEEIKKMPKDEQIKKVKEIQGKAKALEAKGEKVKATAEKIKELKK